jgi:hypothetical protein
MWSKGRWRKPAGRTHILRKEEVGALGTDLQDQKSAHNRGAPLVFEFKVEPTAFSLLSSDFSTRRFEPVITPVPWNNMSHPAAR